MIIYSMFPWTDLFAHVYSRSQSCYTIKQLYPKKYSIHLSGKAVSEAGHPSLKYDRPSAFFCNPQFGIWEFVRSKHDCFFALRMCKDLNKNQLDISYSYHSKLNKNKTHKVAITI